MIEDFCIIFNTVSSCSDIWEMSLRQLYKHFGNQKTYIFSDMDDPIFKGHNVILYDKNLDFRTQYYNSIKEVKEKFCLIMNDDYVFYNDVKLDKIHYLLDILKKDDLISFIRVTKGYNHTDKQYSDMVYYLSTDQDFFYNQQMGIWKTRTLEVVHEKSPISSIGRKDDMPQLEVLANKICREMSLTGLYYYNGEPKRGMYHYDSEICPHIASALVGGEWNLIEYKTELQKLITDYKINVEKRGVYR